MPKASKDTKGKISFIIQTINIIPLLLFGAVIMMLGTHWFSNTMKGEIENELTYVAQNAELIMDTLYPGDYHLEGRTNEDGKTAYNLYKGGADITTNYELFDCIRETNGLDVTLFFQDTRILTTIFHGGVRIIGTPAPARVVQEVLAGGETKFYSNVNVETAAYFALYTPLRNTDGEVVGMICVAKPSKQVNTAISNTVYPLVIADLLAIIVTGLILLLYTNNMIQCLMRIHGFLSEVASGNLNTELDKSVLSRSDELGDIGRSALVMQRSLRTIIEQDPLTELSNRRSADRKIKQIVKKAQTGNGTYSIAMGDIDFFKKVNDTYGHDAGDLVLKKVAASLRNSMKRYGFVARWGGEEFLLVFDHSNKEEAYVVLNEALEDIRDLEVVYEDRVITVTMTFGVEEGDNNVDYSITIKHADDKLYAGKMSGRNRVIN